MQYIINKDSLSLYLCFKEPKGQFLIMGKCLTELTLKVISYFVKEDTPLNTKFIFITN